MIDVNKWIDIPGYEGYYQILISENRVKTLDRIISNGRCMHLKKTKEKKICKIKTGHLFVGLCKDGICTNYWIHRLVMLIKEGPCPEGMEVCHNDGDPANNHPDNLRYDTRSNNHKDMYKHGTHRNPFVLNNPRYFKGKFGSNHHSSIPILQFSLDGNLIKEYESISNASIELKIDGGSISGCCKGKYGYKTAGGFIWKFKI